MNILVCVAGMTGSGKKIVSDFFVDKGFQFIRFGQTVLDVVIENKLEPTEVNERKIREGLRQEHGMAALAVLNFEKIKSLLKKGNVVVDGLYSWSEYKYLRNKLKNQLILIAVFAPPQQRYKRLETRFTKADDKHLRERPATREFAEKRDYSEIENLEKGGPIAMADYTVLNTKDIPFLTEQLKNILIDFKGRLK